MTNGILVRKKLNDLIGKKWFLGVLPGKKGAKRMEPIT